MSNKDELEKIRSQIDAIDSSILKLINQRSLLAKETANLKKSNDIYKPEREAKIIRNLISLNEGPLAEKQIISIFNEIISSCRQLEKEIKVSYLGPEGTFSEEAVKEVFGSSVTKSSTVTIEEAISDVSKGNSDYAIVILDDLIDCHQEDFQHMSCSWANSLKYFLSNPRFTKGNHSFAIASFKTSDMPINAKYDVESTINLVKRFSDFPQTTAARAIRAISRLSRPISVSES